VEYETRLGKTLIFAVSLS